MQLPYGGTEEKHVVQPLLPGGMQAYRSVPPFGNSQSTSEQQWVHSGGYRRL